MSRTALLMVMWVGACKGDDDGILPADTNGAGDDCGDAAPVLQSLTLSNAGMMDPAVDDACGATAVPLLNITAHATDDDGDLHYWTMHTWWDADVDGTVDTSGESIQVSSTQGLACRTFVLEASPLLDRVVQLAVAVGQLAAVDEQLEPLGQEWVVAVSSGER